MAIKKKGVQPEAEIVKEAKNAEKLKDFKKIVEQIFKAVEQVKKAQKEKKNS
jgi:hypothetical protein